MADLEQLYQDGFEIGVSGIRSRCPEDLYQHEDHSLRDAWIDGYKAGGREYKKRRDGYSVSSIDHDEAAKGRLWIESKDENGFQTIRDCEGGTILCKIQLDGDEPYVHIPRHNLTPEMAMILSKAVMKAAANAYRVKKDREYRPANYQADMTVAPTRPRQANAAAPTPATDALYPIYRKALLTAKAMAKLYWHMRQGQETNGMTTEIATEFDNVKVMFEDWVAQEAADDTP